MDIARSVHRAVVGKGWCIGIDIGSRRVNIDVTA